MLLCLDLEQGSDRLVARAAPIAQRWAAPVRIVHATRTALTGPQTKDVMARLHALVDGPLAGHAVDGVELAQGVAEHVIVAAANRCGAIAIVLGRRSRSTVERIYVGSTTSAVISLAQRPVLVLPLDGDESASA